MPAEKRILFYSKVYRTDTRSCADAMQECPTDADLAVLLGEALQSETTRSLQSHITKCRPCKKRLDKLHKLFNSDQTGFGTQAIPNGQRVDNSTAVLETKPLLLKAHESALANSAPHLPEVPGFEVLTEIGRGGMGIVYLARHRQLNRRAALKMVLTGSLAAPSAIQRFVFEAEVLARVQHPQIVQVYEADTFLDSHGCRRPFIAMEYLDGGSLAAYAKRYGPLKPHEAAELVEGLARAVHAAHLQGVVHRDLKPGNILRTREGVFKVSDFGLAKMNGGSAEVTATGLVVGTPAYMAPEQAAGTRSLGPSIDIYALGAILFELLTGRTPFAGDDALSLVLKLINDDPPEILKVRPEIPYDLAAIAMMAISKKPEDRYQSAEGLADDLRQFLDGGVVTARPVGTLTKIARWSKRNPMAATTGVGFFVVMTCWLMLLYWHWKSAEQLANRELVAREKIEQESEKTRELLQGKIADHLSSLKQQACLEFDMAVNWCEAGVVERGVQHFTKALSLAIEINDKHLERAIRINLAGWQNRVVPKLKTLPIKDIQTFCVARNGEWLVTAGHDQSVRIREENTGKVLGVFRADFLNRVNLSNVLRRFYNISLSDNQKWLAAGNSDGKIWLWQVPDLSSTQSPIETDTFSILKVADCSDIWQVRFAADNSLWAACSDGHLRKYQPGKKSLELVQNFPLSQRDLQCLIHLSEDSVWTGDREGKIRQLNPTTGKSKVIGSHSGWVMHFALSPDEKILASCSADGTVKLWSTVNGKAIETSIPPIGVSLDCISFSPDNERLLLGGSDGIVHVWDLRTQIFSLAPIHCSGKITAIECVRNDSDRVAICVNGQIHFFRLPAREERFLPIPALQQDGGFLEAGGLQLLPGDGGPKLLAKWEQSVVHYDLDRSEKMLSQFKTSESIQSISPSDTGASWVSLPSKLLRLTSKGVLESERHWPVGISPRQVYSLKDPTKLLLLDRNMVIRWDLEQPKSLDYLVNMPYNGERIQFLAIQPDGEEFAYSIGRMLHFHNWKSNQTVRAQLQLDDEVLAMQYSPDGKQLLIGMRNYTAELWSTEPVAKLQQLAHHGAVVGVDWSRDGERVITACRDGKANIWDLNTGRPLVPSMKHPYEVNSLAMKPDGSRVFTCSRARTRADVHFMSWPGVPEPMSGTPSEILLRFQQR
jgi:eukaryotic-like serine/threonine-protein kinase